MSEPAPDVLAYVRGTLPPPPARVLEVGAGDGALAAALVTAGYDVTAIDPAGAAPAVKPVALADLDAASGAFDAAVAVLSLHHVEPLEASLARLAEVVRDGGRLVVDEFDIARFDVRAATWWCERRDETGAHRPEDPAAMAAELHAELHPLERLRAALAPAFAVGEPVRGPYLHRWGLPGGLREAEERLIGAGELPATGARLVATRR